MALSVALSSLLISGYSAWSLPLSIGPSASPSDRPDAAAASGVRSPESGVGASPLFVAEEDGCVSDNGRKVTDLVRRMVCQSIQPGDRRTGTSIVLVDAMSSAHTGQFEWQSDPTAELAGKGPTYCTHRGTLLPS
jgi:hypothetical protein